MRRTVNRLYCSVLLFACSCATVLTERGSHVQLSNANPARNCQSLGPVHLGTSMSMERAETQMMNQAAERGANYIHAVGFNHMAYYCPTSSPTYKVAH